MAIVGHGVDVVEVERVARLIAEHGERFLTRCFTPIEQAHGRGTRRHAEHLAARFAAKEAALKALGTGLTHGIAWTDVEIRSDPSGRPTLVLSGHAAIRATDIGADRWTVSLSHTRGLAVASVIAERVGSHP